jgi:hypothetical protein
MHTSHTLRDQYIIHTVHNNRLYFYIYTALFHSHGSVVGYNKSQDRPSTPTGSFSGLYGIIENNFVSFYFQNANDMVMKPPFNVLKDGKVCRFIDHLSTFPE